MNREELFRTIAITGAAVGTVIFFTGIAKTYQKGKTWGLVQAAVNRNPEDKSTFNDYEVAKAAADDIFKKEKELLSKEMTGLKTAYNDTLKAANVILEKEQAAVNAHKTATENRYSEAKNACDALLAKEEKALKDILKGDDAYQALKLARKELKAAEKDTGDIVKKMEAREKTLKAQVKAARTEAESKLFKTRDRIAGERKNGYSEYEKSLVDGRSDEEKVVFTQLKELGASINDRTGHMADIRKLRTAEETATVERYEELAKTVNDIRARERKDVNTSEALAGYLVKEGYGPGDVRLIGAIPIVCGGILYVTLTAMWWKKIADIARAMSRVDANGLLVTDRG